MLSFETPHVEADGVILFPDHADPLLWYYSAGAPRIAIGPGRRPMYDLWVYTEALVHDFLTGTRIPDEMGGGFLTLGVNCRRDDREMRAARRVAAQLRNVDDDAIHLSPIPYTAGSASVIALDAAQGVAEPAAAGDPKKRFVTSVLGGGTPALLGDLQSIFSLSLSDRGAAFLSGMFGTGGMPVGVVYELTYQGLSPAVDVSVHADMTKLRKRFEAGLQGQVQWFKADVSAVIDDLRQSNDVRIDSSTFIDSDAARAAEERALAMFKEDIIQQLFRPAPPAAPQPTAGESIGQAIAALARTGTGAAAGGAAGAAGAGGSLGLTLKVQQETSHLTGDYSYRSRMPVARTDAPQAFLQTMIDPADHDRHTTVVNLGTASAFFDRVEAIVSLPEDQVFRDLNLRQAVVSVSYGEGDPARAPEAKPPLVCVPGGERNRRLAFQRQGRASMAVDYDITYEFDDPPGATVDAHRYQTPRRTSASRAIMVDPMGDFGYRELHLMPGRIPEDVAAVDIDAAFISADGGFTATERFRLGAPFDRPMTQVAPGGADWPVRTADRGQGRFTLAETFVFGDGARFAAPTRQVADLTHMVDAPFEGMRELLVQPNVLSPSVEAIDVEVDYRDPGGTYARRFTRTFQPPFASHQFRWPILSPDARKVSVRATVREGGITSAGEWEETEGPTIVVGNDAARPVDLTVRLIGGQLADLAIDGVLVEVRAPDDTGTPALTELFFAPGDSLQAGVRLISRPGQPLSFDFRTQTFLSDGQTRTADWQTRTGSQQLILSLRSL
ncbi:MAG: hypothetical protein QM656_11430 [Paracoccaceae bacterium]